MSKYKQKAMKHKHKAMNKYKHKALKHTWQLFMSKFKHKGMKQYLCLNINTRQ